MLYQQQGLTSNGMINPQLGQGLYFLQIQKGEQLSTVKLQVK